MWSYNGQRTYSMWFQLFQYCKGLFMGQDIVYLGECSTTLEKLCFLLMLGLLARSLDDIGWLCCMNLLYSCWEGSVQVSNFCMNLSFSPLVLLVFVSGTLRHCTLVHKHLWLFCHPEELIFLSFHNISLCL